MPRLPIVAIMLAAALAAPPVSSLPLPGQITFQGRLTNSAGNPIDGDVSMTFSVYAAASGGTALWFETQTIHVSGGLYSVQLGSQTSLDGFTLDMTTDRWLGVKVGEDAEMAPRYPLTGALYARRSAIAERALTADAVSNADTLDGLHASAFAPISHTQDASTLTGILPVSNGGTGAAGFVAGAVIFSNGTTLAQNPAGFFWDIANLRLGIGTGTPSRPLHVVGDARVDGAFRVASLDVAGSSTPVAGAPPAVPIPDNNPTGVKNTVVVPDLGTAESVAIAVTLRNSNVSGIRIELTDPDGTPYILSNYGFFSGIMIDAVWPPATVFFGNLGAWNGRNPQGTWTLKVTDNNYLNNTFDGQIDAWSVIVNRSGITVTGAASLATPSGTPPISLPTAYAPGATVTNLSSDLLDGLHASDFAPASGGQWYIQNQMSGPQSAGFYISGVARVGGLSILNNGVLELTTATWNTTQFTAAATTNRAISVPDVDGTLVTTGNLGAITATGTIGSGVWQGAPVGTLYGGTGATAVGAAGSVDYSTGSAHAFSLAGTTGQLLHSGGTGSPTWGAVNLASATETTGVLPPANGGTGLSSPVAGGRFLRSSDASTWASSTLQASDLPAGSANYIQNQTALSQSASFSISGSGTLGTTLSVGTNATVTGNLTLNGNATLGDANTDTLTVNAGAVTFPNATTSTYALILGGDSNLYRSAANTLRTDDSLSIGVNATIAGALTVNGNATIGAASTNTLTVNAGAVAFLNATTSAYALILGGDSNLYRSAVDTLRTDDSLSVGGGLTVTSISTFNGSVISNANTTLGNASTDTLTINATPTFATATSSTNALNIGSTDTKIYRSAAATVHIVDNLTVGPNNIKPPIAYGVISGGAAPTILCGSGNFTCTYSATTHGYHITITGHTYSSQNYIALVTCVCTNASLAPFAITCDDGAGKLLVRELDAVGNASFESFSFVVYMP